MANFDETLAIYDRACAKAKIERKGKNLVYTSSNGHMFSQMNKDGELGIRLPKIGKRISRRVMTQDRSNLTAQPCATISA